MRRGDAITIQTRDARGDGMERGMTRGNRTHKERQCNNQPNKREAMQQPARQEA